MSAGAAGTGAEAAVDAGLVLAIKQLVVSTLKLDGLDAANLGDDQPLFGDDGLGLDSVDALELVVALEREFALTIPTEAVGGDVFRSAASLARFVALRLAGVPDPTPGPDRGTDGAR